MLTSRAHASRLLFFFFILANLASLTAASHPADQRHEHHQGPLLNPGEAIASGSDQQHPPLAAVADAELLLPFAGPLAPAAPAVPAAPEAMSSSLARTAPLVFPAAGKHTATVIFAHGLGDTGHGWASAVENWRRRQRLDEVKFVLPHAPQIPITCSLVQAEVDAGIPAERIVLGGFSQGGAMAIFSGLTGPHRIGGIVGLSCWLPLSNKFAGIVAAGSPNRDTPVWLGHGDADPLVRPELGELSAEALKKLGFKVSRTLYPGMPHAACPEELDDVEAFLRERLPPTKQ
ncbi:acyl-protein thioesterase 1 [Colletotrichum higginsianum]|nr:acyl-protein thioesterase 1 [Colletotrichum higginsianum]